MKKNKMNKFIAQQLNRINTPMTSWDDHSTNIVIYRQRNDKQCELSVGSIYDITVQKYVVDPPPGFSLASNWNFGTVPPEENLQAQLLQIMGNMLKFNCRGCTTNIEWEGWLPRKAITINEKR